MSFDGVFTCYFTAPGLWNRHWLWCWWPVLFTLRSRECVWLSLRFRLHRKNKYILDQPMHWVWCVVVYVYRNRGFCLSICIFELSLYAYRGWLFPVRERWTRWFFLGFGFTVTVWKQKHHSLTSTKLQDIKIRIIFTLQMQHASHKNVQLCRFY